MKKVWNIFKERYIGIQGTLFTVFALASFFFSNSYDRFWMFIIAATLFNTLQIIIDELKNNKTNKN
jgi:hypothetical protein